MAYGNVNVKFSPCKAVGQLKSAVAYILGKRPDQIRHGIKKTEPHLYNALGCDRDNFANNVLVTRKLNGKSYSHWKSDTILAHKIAISFHPNDNDRLTYELAYRIARQFANEQFYKKGYQVLFAVHTDTEHIHAHFLVSNCNMQTGKSFRRGRKELVEMSEYFGKQCEANGLVHSVRESFYGSAERRTRGEAQMKKLGKSSFKDELREVIRIEITDPKNRCFEDVVRSLKVDYGVECRVAGNTVSYRHPEYRDKSGKLVSVRGSRLGDMFTKQGIETELERINSAEYEEQYDEEDEEFEFEW